MKFLSQITEAVPILGENFYIFDNKIKELSNYTHEIIKSKIGAKFDLDSIDNKLKKINNFTLDRVIDKIEEKVDKKIEKRKLPLKLTLKMVLKNSTTVLPRKQIFMWKTRF